MGQGDLLNLKGGQLDTKVVMACGLLEDRGFAFVLLYPVYNIWGVD